MDEREDYMARVKEFRVLIASDGSLPAIAATVTARCFPWPHGTRAYGVVSREAGAIKHPAFDDALEQVAKSAAETTTNALVHRWADVRVRVADGPPAAAIIRAAKRVLADVAREIAFFAPAAQGVPETGVSLKVNALAAT